MLVERFDSVLHGPGMPKLEHPLFCHAPAAIRFEIGGDDPVYLEQKAEQLSANPAYVLSALNRASAVYRSLPVPPDILRIDVYPGDEPAACLLAAIRCRTGLPDPQEHVSATESDEDGSSRSQVQLYWDLKTFSFDPFPLLQEIILGDIGGWSGFVSSVYLAGSGPFLYHLYDDRGLDLLGGSRELLLPIWHRFHSWILEQDLQRIDRLFRAEELKQPYG